MCTQIMFALNSMKSDIQMLKTDRVSTRKISSTHIDIAAVSLIRRYQRKIEATSKTSMIRYFSCYARVQHNS